MHGVFVGGAARRDLRRSGSVPGSEGRESGCRKAGEFRFYIGTSFPLDYARSYDMMEIYKENRPQKARTFLRIGRRYHDGRLSGISPQGAAQTLAQGLADSVVLAAAADAAGDQSAVAEFAEGYAPDRNGEHPGTGDPWY